MREATRFPLDDLTFALRHFLPHLTRDSVYRILKAEGLEQAACRIGKGLRIHLRDSGPIPGIVGALGRRGDGEVSFLVPSDGGRREVEVRLRERYAVSPEVANALRVLAGVTQVENL